MIKFIYFDIGGVLLDWKNVFNDAATKFNLTIEDIGSVFDGYHDDITKGNMSAQEFWQKCIQKYNLKDAENFNFLNSWVADYTPINEVYDLIRKLNSKYKIGLLSNVYKGMFPVLLEKGLVPDIRYDQVILSCDVGLMKPDEDFYKLAQKRSGVNPNEILNIDDREDFLDAAKKSGWNTFLFKTSDAASSIKVLEKYLSYQIA